MKSKEIFDSLRVTTVEVAGPLIKLVTHRGLMIKAFVEYVKKTGDIEDENLAQIIEQYNAYAMRDQELVNIAQGAASDELL